MIAKQPSRPVLRWHGGKYKLAPWVVENLPQHRIYTESFGGAASILMAKPRAYAEVYNDLNQDVVNLFRVLQDPVKAASLHRLLVLTPFARDEFELAYQPVDAEDLIERARRLIIRCFMGFASAAHNPEHGTGFRANSNRSGTVPSMDWRHYPDVLCSFTDRLQGVVIENRNAIDLIKQHDTKQTIHYCDPPYEHKTRRPGMAHNYGPFEMSDDQHRELAEVLRSVKGMVALSGYRSSLYDELYGDWKRVEKATFADGARPRTECLWLNPAAQRKGVQQPLFA